MSAAADAGGLGRGSPAGVRPLWEREGRDWPNREHSRFVPAAGIRWHVQIWGEGPTLLLLHGTGASTHSWRALAPLLARRFTVIAPDLPGHGFTEALPAGRLSLPGMAWGVKSLLRSLGAAPALAAGHSAGAAILLRMSLDGAIAPRSVVSLNGALLALRGAPGHLFAPIARLLFSIPLVPLLFAWRATDRAVVERLISGTGSTLDAAGIDLYARLVQSPGHVGAALGMMANWDLRPLEHDLPRLKPTLTLVVGEGDKTIPPAQAERVRILVPSARIIRLPGLGHLAHEERPEQTASIIVGVARGAELLPSADA